MKNCCVHFVNISLNSSQNEKYSDNISYRKSKHNFMFSNFNFFHTKSCLLLGNVEK